MMPVSEVLTGFLHGGRMGIVEERLLGSEEFRQVFALAVLERAARMMKGDQVANQSMNTNGETVADRIRLAETQLEEMKQEQKYLNGLQGGGGDFAPPMPPPHVPGFASAGPFGVQASGILGGMSLGQAVPAPPYDIEFVVLSAEWISSSDKVSSIDVQGSPIMPSDVVRVTLRLTRGGHSQLIDLLVPATLADGFPVNAKFGVERR